MNIPACIAVFGAWWFAVTCLRSRFTVQWAYPSYLSALLLTAAVIVIGAIAK